MSFHHAGYSKVSLISSFVQGFPEVDQALDFLITQDQVNGEANPIIDRAIRSHLLAALFQRPCFCCDHQAATDTLITGIRINEPSFNIANRSGATSLRRLSQGNLYESQRQPDGSAAAKTARPVSFARKSAISVRCLPSEHTGQRAVRIRSHSSESFDSARR